MPHDDRQAPPFTQAEFRAALGSFPTGVTVVTTRDQEGRAVGVTVNSFASVSLAPPLVLWSLRRESSAAPTFRDAGHFAVNILGEEQDHLCRIFAGRNADKFSGLRIGDGIGGVPLLSGVSACLECRTEAIHPGGDHLIFVGRVEGLALSHDIRPLIHCRGAFLSVTAAQDSVVGTMPEFCPGMPNYSS